MATMENAKIWIRDNCSLDKFKAIAEHTANERLKGPDNVKVLAYAVLAIAGFTYLVYTLLSRRKHTKSYLKLRPRSPDPEKPTDVTSFAEKRMKPAERPPGSEYSNVVTSWRKLTVLAAWTPQDFKRPTAPEYQDWSVETTPPLPYRPFRHGPYHITMGLRSMQWDEWIELDNHYMRFHEDKKRRIAERGSKCCRTDTSNPRVLDGAIELLEELSAYLSERYPSMFKKTDVGVDNVLTGESFNVKELTMNGEREDPMQLSARLIQDDLAIMFEKEDGQYYLQAGAILLAGFWRLEDKWQMPLSEIHTSGDVPGFKSKLEKGMMNFFRRVTPEKPVLRNNYFLQVDDNLAWSDSIGSEDNEVIGWFTAEKHRAIQHHYFRSERQSLRRLPRSGGVVFTIRTYFHPITEICQEPYVPGRLASAVRSWGDDVAKYKGRERYGDVLLEYLDKKHEEQVANGLELEKEEDIRAYPW